MTINIILEKDIIIVSRDWEAKVKELKAEHEAEIRELKGEINRITVRHNNWRNDFLKSKKEDKIQIKKLSEKIEELENENEELETSLEEAEVGREANLDAIKKQEEWEENKRRYLENEKALLEKAGEELLGMLVRVSKNEERLLQVSNELREELSGTKQLLANSQKQTEQQTVQNKDLEFQLYLTQKPLPKMPSRTKEFGKKIRIKFRQLIKREKKQELVSRMEVNTIE